MVLFLQVDGGRRLWRRGDRLEQAGQLGPDYQEYGVQRPHYFHQTGGVCDGTLVDRSSKPGEDLVYFQSVATSASEAGSAGTRR